MRPSRNARTVALVCLAAVCASLAAWCSGGTLAVTSVGPDGVRLGLLPSLTRLTLLLAAALAACLVPAVRRLKTAPLFLSALALLPWIPGAPVVFLLWTGPVTRLVWTAVFAGLLVAQDWRGPTLGRHRLVAPVRDPARAPVVAAVAAFVLFSSVAWLVRPMRPGGDEPHYLIITQSLLSDFDLKIENNHRARQYESYYPVGDLKPDFLRRGADGQVYSVHAPGLSAIIAPAFAVAGYGGVTIFLILLSSLGAALAWSLAYRVSGSVAGAWFGWAAVSLSTTAVFHAFAVYPDGLGGILVLSGAWALVRLDRRAEPPPALAALALVGAALAFLPWLHTRFAVLAGVLGVLILLRIAQRFGGVASIKAAAAFAAVPAIGALAWLGFFYMIYGTPDPRVAYGWATGGRWAYVTSGLGGLFFDQQFGLLPYAPVLFPALIALVLMLRRAPTRRLSVEILLVMAPYLVEVTHFRMWWAGWSAPARFFVPVLPLLTMPAAVLWERSARAASRASLLFLLACTAFATACLVFVSRGRLAFNVRDGYALWLDWLSRVVDLAQGLPSFFRTTEGAAFAHAAIWLVCFFAAWLVLHVIERAGGGTREVLAAATPAVYGLAVMAALGLVWRANGAPGVTPSPAQLDLLRAAAGPGLVGVQLGPLRRLDQSTVPSRLAIDTTPRLVAARERPLFVLPFVPAGRYRLRAEIAPNAAGALWIEILPDDFHVREFTLSASADPVMLDVAFPVNVRALIVRGDERARAAVRHLTLLPQAVVASSRLPTGAVARRAIRYGASTAYFFDEGAYLEPEAFWVKGADRAVVAFEAPERSGPADGPLRLFLRNALVENRVRVEVGAWREDLALQPGEERTLTVPRPLDQSAALVSLTSASGFRPAEFDRASQDRRFLGVWVQPR